MLAMMGMKAAVVYESMFGNTRTIAEAIAGGLTGQGPIDEVVVLPVAAATAEEIVSVGLLVVGGPTHMRRMTSHRTRVMRAQSRAYPVGSGTGDPEEWARAASTGVREWLASLPMAPPGRRAAAFDTRLSYLPAVGASPMIALYLRSRGYRVDAVSRCFFVESPHGPLKAGERERASAWGAALGRQL
jgi:hypothetical protein